MKSRKLSLTSFNLYNLNLPGRRMYRNAKGWSDEIYGKKVAWTGFMLKAVEADLFAFQELWHGDALKEAMAHSELDKDYDLVIPPNLTGQGIACSAAIRSGMLRGEPRWISKFPDDFKLETRGGDPQTPSMAVNIRAFSRPVLQLSIQPRDDAPAVEVFITHLKSKAPTSIYRESWYRQGQSSMSQHSQSIGSALSTIRRTAEATALRMILTKTMRKTATPVIVMGDLNDGQHSNTLDILTQQPRYLSGLSKGGGDAALYTGQTLQQYRSERDVYYTHNHQGRRQSLDHILVSEQFYDHSHDRLWSFDGMDIYNDHLNSEQHQTDDGASDHGVVRTRFTYKPAKASQK